jgi:hypothetical protein
MKIQEEKVLTPTFRHSALLLQRYTFEEEYFGL